MKLNINGKIVELDNEKVKEAIEKDSQIDLTNESLVIRTTEEEKSYKENISKEAIKVAGEIGRKNIIKGLGIEAEGVHKSDDSSLKAINDLISSRVDASLTEAKIEPDKKVDELNKDIGILKGTIDNLTKEKQDLSNGFKSYKDDQVKQKTLSELIPDNVLNSKKDELRLLGMDLNLSVNENGRVLAIGEDGSPLKNKTTLEPLPLSEVINDYYSSNPHRLKTSSGGAGEGDSRSSSGKQSIEEFTKEMRESGVKDNSPEFVKEYSARLETGTVE